MASEPGNGSLQAELLQLAEDEPELCRELLRFLREPALYGKFTVNRGGTDVQWDVTQRSGRKKLTVR